VTLVLEVQLFQSLLVLVLMMRKVRSSFSFFLVLVLVLVLLLVFVLVLVPLPDLFHFAQKGEHCFDQRLDVIETGAGRPCVGLGSNIQNFYSSVIVPESALDVDKHEEDEGNGRCVDVTISSRSIFSVEQPEQVPFSPLTKVRNFDSFDIARNEDGAIVGRCVGFLLLLLDLCSTSESYDLVFLIQKGNE
jgi:hypothetical protein